MKINVRLRQKNYIFETKPGLFSKNEVDPGSKLLIESMNIYPTDIVLDLGCGWGPIGIVASNLATRGKIYMVDADIRAVKYSHINAELNNVRNVEIKVSDGFEEVKNVKFDVILSNPPSHSANETIIEFIEGAKHSLKKEGKLYFVTEKRIGPFIKRAFERVFGNYKEIVSKYRWVVSMAIS